MGSFISNKVIVDEFVESHQFLSRKGRLAYRWISVKDRDDKAQPILGDEQVKLIIFLFILILELRTSKISL
jgi:hypothetical protein